MNIVLVGLKNVGKTTIGMALAKSSGCEFIDLDPLTLELYNSSNNEINKIAELYTTVGEDKFRQLELDVMLNITAEDSIISTGGGSYMAPKNAKILQELGHVIYLYLSEDEFVDRLAQYPHDTYLKERDLSKVYQARDDVLQNISQDVFQVQNKQIMEIVNEIMKVTNGL